MRSKEVTKPNEATMAIFEMAVGRDAFRILFGGQPPLAYDGWGRELWICAWMTEAWRMALALNTDRLAAVRQCDRLGATLDGYAETIGVKSIQVRRLEARNDELRRELAEARKPLVGISDGTLGLLQRFCDVLERGKRGLDVIRDALRVESNWHSVALGQIYLQARRHLRGEHRTSGKESEQGMVRREAPFVAPEETRTP